MTFSYISNYDSVYLRGRDRTERPWNLHNEILCASLPGSTLLDIGCGTAFKLIPLVNHFSEIIGIDISKEMVNYAIKSVNESGKNIKIVQANSSRLPFKDNSVDTITCMLSKWDANEIARVIKPSGNVIIEHVGCEDKIAFKKIFGKDDQGWRGQLINYNQLQYLQSFYELLNPLFESVSINNGFWKTKYNEKGILELLKFTPTIRNFNEITDHYFFKHACEKFNTQEGIELIQNRILIHAKSPRFF